MVFYGPGTSFVFLIMGAALSLAVLVRVLAPLSLYEFGLWLCCWVFFSFTIFRHLDIY